MPWRVIAATLLTGSLDSSAIAARSETTATYDGIAIKGTSGDALVKLLLARGARKASTKLYQYRTKEAHPSPSGNAAVDERLDKLYEQMNSWDKLDLFATGFETRLRRPIPPRGEAEIEISTCPADDRVASVIVRYPPSADTRVTFAKITRGLTSAIGRPPDETSASKTGNILVDWNFADGTKVRAMFVPGKSSDMVISSGIAPITISYMGLPVVGLCAINFVPRRTP